MDHEEDFDDEDPYLSAFHKELDEYLNEYCKFLETKFTKSTVNNHWSVIHDFIDFAIGYKNVNGFEDLTVGIAGSKFAQYYSNLNAEKLSTFTARNTLYGYFSFIADKYGIANHEFLHKLKPKRMR